jgi:hypothetical protein
MAADLRDFVAAHRTLTVLGVAAHVLVVPILLGDDNVFLLRAFAVAFIGYAIEVFASLVRSISILVARRAQP